MANKLTSGMSDTDRFFFYVGTRGDDACWEWLGAKDRCGYGCFSLRSKQLKAHRFSWFLKNGDIPTDKIIMHSCDNPSCVNPKHLVLGTNAENTQDMVAKGRCNPPRGSRFGNSILSESDIKEIVWLIESGMIDSEICKIYKVTHGAIANVRKGKTWNWLTKRGDK